VPIVWGRGAFAHASVERNIVKPAATINGPKRLSGRRYHATTPAKM
jgi:hypothetical protein